MFLKLFIFDEGKLSKLISTYLSTVYLFIRAGPKIIFGRIIWLISKFGVNVLFDKYSI